MQKSNRAKYDWGSLKIDFMSGDRMTVSEFLRDKGMLDEDKPNGGPNGVNTKGRAAEKESLKMRYLEKIKQEIYRETREKILKSKLFKIDIEQLNKMHETLITLCSNEIARIVNEQREIEQYNKSVPKDQRKKIPPLDISRIEKIWKMIKAEKYEPTNITRQELDSGLIETNPAQRRLAEIYKTFNPDEVQDTIDSGHRIVDAGS